MSSVKQLEDCAKVLLEERKRRNRPIIIEFAGTPKSGKTTLIEIIEQFFRRNGFIVRVPQEGAEVFRAIPRNGAAYNIRTGIYAIGALIDGAHDKNHDLIILDRGICDAFFWMEYWLQKGNLLDDEKHTTQKFFMLWHFSQWLDFAFLVSCSVKEAMRRESELSITSRPGPLMNPEAAEFIHCVYDSTCEKLLCQKVIPLAILDTTHSKALDTGVEMLMHLFNHFEFGGLIHHE